ncbi:MAG: response regulator [Acidimicrobiia bacterium]|nr:response regulator [Acidimicrobiia bacterium]
MQILVVEDNPADVRLIKEAFREGGPAKMLHVVEDGVEAMEFLRGEGSHQGAPKPDLVLLDLNLPRKNGCELLREMRHDELLCMIPTVMFSSSSAQDDIQRAYRAHVNCFVTKPDNLDEFLETIGRIEEFWLETVRLPESEG